MKKSQRQLIKETFAKTRDERYQEMTKGEKIGYWLFILFGCVLMLCIWLMKT